MNVKFLLTAFSLVTLSLVFTNAVAAQDTLQKADTEAAVSSQVDEEKKELYEKLANYLSGTKWTGQFSLDGMDNENLTKEEYYILSAEKMEEGDYWKLVARIKYGTHDLTVPLPLEVKWAGETPVITVDKMAVPGLGTFDARVLIRRGKYSGTWAHNDVGGHLFGEIEKMTEEEMAELEAEANKGKRNK